MKKLILVLLLFAGLLVNAFAQGKVTSLKNIKTDASKPVYSYKIAEDSLCSSFMIEIRDKVKLHKHESHSENVYVLEGEGLMQLGDTTYIVKKGDHVFIPMNTAHSLKVKGISPVKVLSVQSPRFDNDRIFLE